MSEKKLGPSDFEAEIERLKAAGKLPTLDQVLNAVADTRKRYAARFLNARQSSDPEPDRVEFTE